MFFSLMRAASVCLLIAVTQFAFAATPNPPVLLCQGSDCQPSGGTTGPISYDLYETDNMGRGTIPFSVNWPNSPNTNRTIQVPGEMSLQQAAGVSGAVINVGPGNHGALNIQVNDQRWNFDNNATLTGITIGRGDGSVQPQRIVINGGRLNNTSAILRLTADDLLVHNVNWRYYVMIVGNGLGTVQWDRVAFVQNSLFAYNAMMLLGTNAGNNANDLNTDFIMAGNFFAGGMDPATANGGQIEYGVRIQGVNRAVVVDNRGRNGIQNRNWKNAYRVHKGSENIWLRRNMTEYGDAVLIYPNASGGAPSPWEYLGRMWIYDHRAYIPGPAQTGGRFSLRQQVSSSSIGPLTTDGNRGYEYRLNNSSGVNSWLWQAQSGDSIGDDRGLPYQDPPSHGQWLISGGVRPGANHGPVVDSTFAN